MNDERIVEVIAARIRLTDEPMDSRKFAELILAALRGAGFSIVAHLDLETMRLLDEAVGGDS